MRIDYPPAQAYFDSERRLTRVELRLDGSFSEVVDRDGAMAHEIFERTPLERDDVAKAPMILDRAKPDQNLSDALLVRRSPLSTSLTREVSRDEENILSDLARALEEQRTRIDVPREYPQVIAGPSLILEQATPNMPTPTGLRATAAPSRRA